jgi:hypothetical protein
MEGILALLTPFGAFLMVFGIIYVSRSAKNKETLSMLERGFTPKEIEESFRKKDDPNKNLSTGLMFAGAALGVLVGHVLTLSIAIEKSLAYISGAFLFGGIGLIISYFFTKEENK